jgi:predicted AlkP superfamily phosphohydrolase/phosphomutase
VAPRLVVLGWDSATFDVIDPLLAGGRLPALASLVERGSRAPLRSGWPPMTDCAWTSAFTGRNAAGHGIFGSWYRAPGAYRCRYFSARDRRAPAVWELAQGVRFLVWNVPMTFPPTAVDGVMVSGYGAPPGSRFCSPDGVQDKLGQRYRLDDLLDRAPHTSLEVFFDDLVRGLQVQAEALVWAARDATADCVVAVWPHVDRAQHFFWRFRGTNHHLAEAVDRVYEAMDATTAEIIDAFDDADVLIVSDHGAGSLRGDVNLGAWLVRNGHARYGRRSRRASLVRLAWSLHPSVRRLGRKLAPGTARRAFGATLAGQLGSFDWATTEAFVGFHGDLWLNLAGREPEGCVEDGEAHHLLDALAEELMGIADERNGEPVFAAVHRRDEIFSGPAIDLAPDLMLDTWSNGYRIAPGREFSEELVAAPAPLAGVDEAWSSDHRPLGIFVAGGPRVRAGAVPELHLFDVCPTVLALLGAPVPEGIDGRVATEVVDPVWLDDNPIRVASPTDDRGVTAGEYSDEEAAAVAAHLKDLGYIE